jgi:hypothetical protein
MRSQDSIRGRWWIHGAEGQPLPGTLDVGVGSPKLSIWSPCEKGVEDILLQSANGDSFKITEVIHGQDEENRPVTLFGCGVSEHGSSQGLEHWQIFALAAVKGLHINSWSEPVVRAVSINLELLNRWFGRNLLIPSVSENQQPTYSQVEVIDLPFFVESGVQIRFSDSVLRSTSWDEDQFRHGSSVCFHFEGPRSMAEVSSHWVPWVIRLFGMLIGTTVHTTEVRVFTEDPYQPGSSMFGCEGLLLRSGKSERKQNRSRDPLPHEMIASFSTVKDKLDQLVVQWNRVCSELEPMLALFSAVALHHSLYLEARFLFLVQALEIYHSRSSCFESKDLPKDEHASRVAAAEAVLPNEIWPWAKGKLSLNSRSLKQKLLDIFTAHKAESPRLIGDIENAASKIAYTRNHLTHHHENVDEKRLLTSAEIGRFSWCLESLTWVILLKEIGLGGSPVEHIVRKAEGIRMVNLES